MTYASDSDNYTKAIALINMYGKGISEKRRGKTRKDKIRNQMF